MTTRCDDSAAWNRALALVLLLAGAGAAPAHAELDLGRLFLTPNERVALERLRAEARAVAEQPSGHEKPASSATVDRAAPVSVTGYVARSDGRSSAWLNGRMVHDHASGEEGMQAASADLPGVALRRVDGSIVRLRVGQTYHPADGTISEGFEPKRELATPPQSPPEHAVAGPDSGGRP